MRKYSLVDIVERRISTDQVFSDLTLDNIQENYKEFAKDKGCRYADDAMQRLYGSSWEKHQTTVWQWYDDEVKKNEAVG